MPDELRRASNCGQSLRAIWGRLWAEPPRAELNPVLELRSLSEGLQRDFRVGAIVLSKMDIAVSSTADVADEMEPKPIKHRAAVSAMIG